MPKHIKKFTKGLSATLLQEVLNKILKKFRKCGKLTKAERVFVMEHHKTMTREEKLAAAQRDELEGMSDDELRKSYYGDEDPS